MKFAVKIQLLEVCLCLKLDGGNDVGGCDFSARKLVLSLIGSLG